MDDNLTLALKYYYFTLKKQYDNGKIKGLQRQGVFKFIKAINDLQYFIENDNIKDLKEVLTYGK